MLLGPPRPLDARPLSQLQREALFGRFRYVPTPKPGNPERVQILENWTKRHIAPVVISQLGGRVVHVHVAIASQFSALWSAWERADLIDRVISFNGSFAPRFVRGSTRKLSNHAWGTAFDINAPHNRLGHVPAMAGTRGSVRELVPIAYAHGFFWGGWFKARPDGMHFEAFRVLEEQL